jgi:hypothetical protein
MKTFTAFVLPDLSGTVVVHDRYQNYLVARRIRRQYADRSSARSAIIVGYALSSSRTRDSAASTIDLLAGRW